MWYRGVLTEGNGKGKIFNLTLSFLSHLRDLCDPLYNFCLLLSLTLCQWLPQLMKYLRKFPGSCLRCFVTIEQVRQHLWARVGQCILVYIYVNDMLKSVVSHQNTHMHSKMFDWERIHSMLPEILYIYWLTAACGLH